MKTTFPRLLKTFFLSFSLILLSSMAGLFAQPVVNLGAPVFVNGAIEARWRGLNNTGGVNTALYLGNTNMGAGGANRVSVGFSGLYFKPGNNTVSFTYDNIGDRLIGTINGNTIFYTSVSTKLVGAANVCRMNGMQIFIRNSGITGDISFNTVMLDANPIGPFNIVAGTSANWNVQNYDFSQGFTISGIMTLSAGVFANNESAKLDITVGEMTPVTSTATDLFCDGFPSSVYFTGLLPNKTYTVDYLLDLTGYTSPSFTSSSTGTGNFSLGTLTSADFGRIFRANTFNVSSGCAWNGLINNVSTLTQDPGCLLLPIERIQFIAVQQNNGVKLNWTTTNETNCSHFIIEYSRNGVDWQSLGRVNASGNSSQGNQYTFSQNDLKSGVNYYRLKQVNNDLSFSFSKTINLNIRTSHPLKVSPNPVKDRLYIKSESNQLIRSLSVSALDGRTIMNIPSVRSGTSIDMKALSPGFYLIKVIYASGEMEVKKVIKE